MLSRNTLLLAAAGLLPAAVLARTDLSGCTSTISGNSYIYYVPGTGEICDFIDCGGGRAPPITTKPGCYGYTGTATVTPSYLPGFGADGAAAASSSATPSDFIVLSGTTSFPDAATTATTTAVSSAAPQTTTSTTGIPSLPGVVVISGTDGTTTTITGPVATSNSTNTSEPPGIVVTNGSTRTVFGTNPTPTKATSTSGSSVPTAAAVPIGGGASGLLGVAAALGAAGMALL